jgi:hypothetical protein
MINHLFIIFGGSKRSLAIPRLKTTALDIGRFDHIIRKSYGRVAILFHARFPGGYVPDL